MFDNSSYQETLLEHERSHHSVGGGIILVMIVALVVSLFLFPSIVDVAHERSARNGQAIQCSAAVLRMPRIRRSRPAEGDVPKCEELHCPQG